MAMAERLQSDASTVVDRQLDTGVRVITVLRADAPYAVAGVWLKGGSAADEAGREGTAHLLEHLLPLHPCGETTTQIAIERMGGLLTPETGRDYLAFPIAAAVADALPKMVAWLVAAMAAPPSDATVLEREKTLLRLEMMAQWDDPLWAVKTVVEARLFAGTPYAHPPSGWLESVAHLELDAVQRYHARQCIAPNAALIAVLPRLEHMAALEVAVAALPKVPTPLPSADTSQPFTSAPAPSTKGQRDGVIWGMGWRLTVAADEEAALRAWLHYWQSVLLPVALGSGVQEWRLFVNPTRQGWAIVLAVRSRVAASEVQRRIAASLRQTAAVILPPERLSLLQQRLLLEHRCRIVDPLECARSVGQAWALYDNPTAPSGYAAAVAGLSADSVRTFAQRMAEAEPLTFEVRGGG
ncbi:putative zinc protease [bacterium HR17]|uniref:Putative zinc protease n=1 Tax=Candidatus Fervidibacter japonicus TaxID=2035412 RepID=A0A2H5XGH7_9BACT|nr:putative zinc protease [bacterium HR17]